MPIRPVTDPDILKQLGTPDNVVAPNPMFPGQMQQQQLNNAKDEATLPYAGPSAAANLNNTQASTGKTVVDTRLTSAQLPYAGQKAAAEAQEAQANAAIAQQKARDALNAPDGAAAKKQSALDATRNLVQSLNKARGLVDNWSTGWGGAALGGLPATEASQLDTVINQEIRGNIFKNWVEQMKAQSDTGGTGIGRIMQSEIPLVTGSLGALDPVKMGRQGTLDSLNQIQDRVLRQAAMLNGENPDNPKVIQKYAMQFLGAPAAGGTPPTISGGGTPPPSVGGNGGNPPTGPADYSGMVGGPSASVATMDPNSPAGAFAQTYRNEYDPVMANTLSTFIKKGVPFDTAARFAQSHGFNPPSLADYAAAVAFAKSHRGATNVEATRSVPTTLGERLASSPASALLAGAATGATAGLSDVAGRAVVGPDWDANRAALAATNPGSDLAGNVLGGAVGAYGAGAAADAAQLGARARMLLGAKGASAIGKAAPVLGDMAYGATYGASENPGDPLTGAATGAVTGGIAGAGGRAAARTLGSIVAPSGGNLAPIYQANPSFRPTVGQALSASDSRVARALGLGEQAAESIPALGGIQTSARTAATDQMQRGAFNMALGDIGKQLPENIDKGTQAHAFLQKSFNEAYDNARSGMQFVADPQYAQDLGAWQRSPDALALSADQTSHVQNVIASALKGRVKGGTTMDGANYKAAASDLSAIARKWAGNQSTAGQAAYLRDFVSIMDDAAKRASPPEAAQALENANRGYAKAVVIENAAKSAGGEPAEFSGKQLLKAVQGSDSSVRDRAFLRGQGLMQDYATAASKLSPSLADSGTPQRLAWMKGLGGGEAALLGGAAAMGHPLALAPWAINTLGNLPGVRNAVGAAMAPRDLVLPPVLAKPLNVTGRKLKDVSPYIGRGATLADLAYLNGR